tara:strand:+ start:1002 stop:1421 length:420 start_codon:yes stop_codon:yes gene_type:complete
MSVFDGDDTYKNKDYKDYDPYDDKKNGRYFKCQRGHYIMDTRWCCKECWLEQQEYNKKKKERTFEYLFGDFTNINNTDEFDPLLEYYKILQLIPPKTKEEIRKQYLKLSLKHHPDKNNNSITSVTKFQEIATAYNKLIN